MLFYECKPFVRQALHSKFDSSSKDVGYSLKTKDSRLFFVLSGSGSIIIDNVPYELKPNTAILFKSCTEYKWQVEQIEYYGLNFDYSHDFSHIKQRFHPFASTVFDESLAFDCGFIEDCPQLNSPIVVYNAERLRHQIKSIVTEYVVQDEFSQSLLSILTLRTILEMLRLKRNEENFNIDSVPIIKKIIEYIYSNYSQKISNEAVAKMFNFNPSYLGRIFKKHTGQTLHGFILSYRIEMAKEILVTQNIPISEIYKAVGFNDFYHFSKIFKAQTGYTPSQYRANHITTK